MLAKRKNEIQKIAKELVKNGNRSEYKSLIKGLGSMIIQNGVYGTVVFLKAKNEDKHKAVIADLKEFLNRIGLYNSKEDFLDFLEKTPNLPVIQEKILEFTNWYRRYVEIV